MSGLFVLSFAGETKQTKAVSTKVV
jgi:hypothetical protein